MAFAGQTSTTADAMLKRLYTGNPLMDLTIKNRPTMAWIPKNQSFFGSGRVVPFIIGDVPAVSADMNTAITRKSYSTSKSMLVTHSRYNAVAAIDNLVAEQSMKSEGGFVKVAEKEISLAMNALSNRVAQQVWGNGGGAIGTVSVIGTTSITLTSKYDAINFNPNMEIEFASTDGTSGSLRTGTITVTAVDRSNGILTTDATSGVTGLAVGDSVFLDGDFGSTIYGIPAWIPLTAPTSGDSFFSLDRSTDPTRLGGVRVSSSDIAGELLESKIAYGINELEIQGGMPDVIWVHNSVMWDLQQSLSSKGMLNIDEYKVGRYGFKTFEINGVKVLADRWCPRNRAYVLQSNSWELASIGAPVKLQEAGGRIFRDASYDAVEARCVSYSQVVCKAPGLNCVVDLSE